MKSPVWYAVSMLNPEKYWSPHQSLSCHLVQVVHALLQSQQGCLQILCYSWHHILCHRAHIYSKEEKGHRVHYQWTAHMQNAALYSAIIDFNFNVFQWTVRFWLEQLLWTLQGMYILLSSVNWLVFFHLLLLPGELFHCESQFVLPEYPCYFASLFRLCRYLHAWYLWIIVNLCSSSWIPTIHLLNLCTVVCFMLFIAIPNHFNCLWWIISFCVDW